MRTGCYVCGSPEIAPGSSVGSHTCERCKPARDHVASMQRGPDGSAVAVCPCGWRFEQHGAGRHEARHKAVEQHWRAMIEAAA